MLAAVVERKLHSESEADMEYDDLKAFALSLEAGEDTAANVEREIEVRARELMRQVYQMHIDSRGSGEVVAPVVDQDGVERSESRLHRRRLETVFGTVSVERTGYGEGGLRSLHPLDAEMNLPREKYSHEVRRRVAIEVASRSFEGTLETIATNTAAKVPKRQAEQLALRAATDFDAFYQERSIGAGEVTQTADLLILTVDQKGIVVKEEDLREGTRSKLEKQRAEGAEVRGRRKRMATVAAVYTVAPQVRTVEEIGRQLGPLQRVKPRSSSRPESKRVWASLAQEPKEVITAAFEEANKRDPQRKKTWVVLVDGALHQLDLISKIGRAYSFTIVVDLLHVLGYLGEAAKVLATGKAAQQHWIWVRLQSLLRGNASHIAAGMRRSATRRSLSKKKRAPVDACARYLLNHKRYLHYDLYLEKGFPIASGVIEGACRHLIADRMQFAGCEWRLPGAEAVLRLRAIKSSGDFDQYWSFHEKREQARVHASAYKAGVMPTTKHPKRRNSHLKIVK